MVHKPFSLNSTPLCNNNNNNNDNVKNTIAYLSFGYSTNRVDIYNNIVCLLKETIIIEFR